MIYWNTRSYDESTFRKIWLESNSIAECARRLNLTIYGSTYKTLKSTALQLGLNQDHMSGSSWSKGRSFTGNPAKPIEEWLKTGTTIGSSALKKKLFQEGLKEKKCEQCGIVEWQNKPAPLQLDHVNGINNDNRLENLRILCANCHAQTETFCRGKGHEEKIYSTKCIICALPCRPTLYWHKECNLCIKCKAPCRRNLCSRCRPRNPTGFILNQKTKIDWPSNEELLRMLAESNYTQVGKQLGVSDNAIRKRLRR